MRYVPVGIKETKKKNTAIRKTAYKQKNDVWEVTNATLRQITEKKFGTVKTSNDKPWISDATWDIIPQKNDLKTKLISDGSLWPDYRESAKRVRKAARNDKSKSTPYSTDPCFF